MKPPRSTIPTVDPGDRQKGRGAASYPTPRLNPASISKADRPDALARGRQPTVSPFGDGETSRRVADKIASIPDFGALLKKGFYDRGGRDMMRTLVIAEAGVNHSAGLETALALVEAAADAGADIVKFQTFNASSLAGKSARKADYQQRTTDAAESQRAMLKRLELPHSAHPPLIARARERGIEFLSTPFDHQSLEFPASTGPASDQDRLGRPHQRAAAACDRTRRHAVDPAPNRHGHADRDRGGACRACARLQPQQRVTEPCSLPRRTARRRSTRKRLYESVSLLHCTTEYPCPPEDVNLAAMQTMRTAFQLPVGYSDHTDGIEISLAAVAMGATIIEKHLTLDRNAEGPITRHPPARRFRQRMVSAIRR